VIAHVVLFKPKSDVPIDKLRSFAQLLKAVRGEVETIRRAFVGRAVEGLATYRQNIGDTAYEYAAVLEFDDKEGLLTYLNHPKHQELGMMFWELCESTAILDVEARDLDDDPTELLV
jgi:hypothetical protein